MAGDKTNIISPSGFAALRAEYDLLFVTERPKLVETISWAAGNGDRSENGDYIYGRKRLREIDRRLSFLARRMKAARVVDPAEQPDKHRIWFGATVDHRARPASRFTAATAPVFSSSSSFIASSGKISSE